jgi:biuret amidohydrolase
MKKDISMDKLDPARTALVVVHMVKGVAGEVDTPFNRIFRRRAEEKGLMGVQKRLLDGFRTGKAKGTKVVCTAVTYQPGYPGVTRNSRLFRTLIDSGGALLEGTPAVEVIDDLAPRPGEPVVRGQATNGFDRTELDTILRQAGVDTLVLVGIATDVAVESTARAACDLGYRTIVVSDACDADSDEAHAHALEVIRGWFGETAAAAEVLSALGDERTDSGKSAEATRTAA